MGLEETNWLLSLLARCDGLNRKVASMKTTRDFLSSIWAKYSSGNGPIMGGCWVGTPLEVDLRNQPTKYVTEMCRCFKPRLDTQVYWSGKWYANGSQVPLNKTVKSKKMQPCTMP